MNGVFDLTTAAVVGMIGVSVQVWLVKPGNETERALIWSWQIIVALAAGFLAPVFGSPGLIIMAALAHGSDVVRNLYHRWYAHRVRQTLPVLPQRPLLPREGD